MSEIQSIKLSQLTSQIYKTINDAFVNKTFWVVADITNYSYFQQKGYHYFDLVEKQEGTSSIIAKVCGVAWGTGALKIRDFEKITGQKFKNDINVLMKVSVDFHSTHGLKLTMVDLDINFTIGVLEQQKQDVLNKLLTDCSDYIKKVGDKFITKNNQLSLNTVIQKIAIVTSSSSAGYHDFTHTLENNSHKYVFHIDNYFTAVQGEINSNLMRLKLVEVFNSGKSYDALVLIRGGGSQTDFLIFDTFALGQIVAKFPIPIITGIGHQKNETIVDMLAHSPTKTPTKAAEFIIAHNKSFEEAILDAQKTILIKSQQLFSSHFQSLSSLNSIIVNKTRNILSGYKDQLTGFNQICINTTKTILFNKHRELVALTNQITSIPKSIVSNKQNDLKNVISNLGSYCRINIQNQKGYIGHHVSVFKLMSPENILKKGFAIVYHKGKIVTKAENISIGTDITVLLSETKISATVKSKNISDGTEFNL